MAESVSANAGEPLERLLDLILYAPLGLVSQLDELLPGLVETGRSRASMARTIGQFAVRTGSTQVHPVTRMAMPDSTTPAETAESAAMCR